MTQELLRYVNSLGDLSVRIWLDAIVGAAKNGTKNVIYRDVMIKYKLNMHQVKTCFNFKQAKELDLIKVLTETETFVSVNFKNKVTKVKDAPVVAAPKPDKKPVITTTTTELVVFDEHGLIVGNLPKEYIITAKLRTILIGDYCQFYKNLIVARAALVGNVVQNPANPKLSKYDPKAFDEIATYLKDNGFRTEQAIRYAFQRIYTYWHHMPANIQDYFTPAMMNRNFNQIYAQMVQIGKKTNPNKTKKDEQLAEKLNGTQQKDYSHMVKPG